ncbi:MAG: 30S ribosomal protein S26e [Candidatus Lokiarchaeota archaeon]|nr:30S ribosomal protein S26e [Candidatus Lokiarchaeota archaeon]
MPKKRKNSGKGQSGKNVPVQCSRCGRLVPRSKAKKVTRPTRLMEGVIAKELRQAGAILPNNKSTRWLCVSCAVHSHTVKIRSADDRKKKGRL